MAAPAGQSLPRTFGSRFQPLSPPDDDLAPPSPPPSPSSKPTLFWMPCCLCQELWASTDIQFSQPFVCPAQSCKRSTPGVVMVDDGTTNKHAVLYRHASPHFQELLAKLSSDLTPLSSTRHRPRQRHRRRRLGQGVPSHCYEHHTAVLQQTRAALRTLKHARATLKITPGLQDACIQAPSAIGSALRALEGPTARQTATRERAARLWQQAQQASRGQAPPSLSAPSLGRLQPQPKPAVLPFYPELGLANAQ
eukprot:m.28738 g.28738  ORF g.28738 m.28738 type:complete len:251 (+) comp11875_c0_seq1:226-978(+)